MDGALTPMRIRTPCFGLNVHLIHIAALVLVSRSQTAFPPIESDLATRDYTSANTSLSLSRSTPIPACLACVAGCGGGTPYCCFSLALHTAPPSNGMGA